MTLLDIICCIHSWDKNYIHLKIVFYEENKLIKLKNLSAYCSRPYRTTMSYFFISFFHLRYYLLGFLRRRKPLGLRLRDPSVAVLVVAYIFIVLDKAFLLPSKTVDVTGFLLSVILFITQKTTSHFPHFWWLWPYFPHFQLFRVHPYQ